VDRGWLCTRAMPPSRECPVCPNRPHPSCKDEVLSKLRSMGNIQATSTAGRCQGKSRPADRCLAQRKRGNGRSGRIRTVGQRFWSPRDVGRQHPAGTAPDHAPLGNQEQPRPSGLRHTLGGVRRGVRLTAVRTAVNVVLYPADGLEVVGGLGVDDVEGGVA
jgi:hypothetical protein